MGGQHLPWQPPQLLLHAFVIRFCRPCLLIFSLCLPVCRPFPRMDRRSHNVRICCFCCWYVKGKIYMCTCVSACVQFIHILFCCCHPAGHTYAPHTLTYTYTWDNSTICPLVFLSLCLTHSTPFRRTPASSFSPPPQPLFLFLFYFTYFLLLLVLRGLGLGVAVL